MLTWSVLGCAIGVILNYLLTPQNKPEKASIIIDSAAYVVIFVLAMLAVSNSLTANAATIFALLACFLFIVPIARSFTTFRTAKARHPELRETSDTVLIYSLLFIPALLPVLSFLKVVGISAELTQFLFNFITFDFLLVAGLTMLASADIVEAADAAGEAKKEVATPKETPAAAPTPKASPSKSEPVVEFSNPGAAKKPATPKKLPPRKPVPNRPVAPKKPAARGNDNPTNAPSGVKAPAKPKKRF